MFQFVPRKVAQKARTQQHASKQTSVLAGAAQAAERPVDDVIAKRKTTDATTHDEDLAALLWFSLSEHSLWTNVDLRRALASADDGWLPLSVLRRHTAYLAHLSHSPAESAFVKAVRVHAADRAPKAAWSAMQMSSPTDDSGGYEIRRKDWRDALSRARNSMRHEWESRTVYMECVPLAHRAVPGMYRFTAALLGLASPEQVLTDRIQSIFLPAHHLDRPGDVPKPKGFAFVTFSDESDAARLATDWPWLPRRSPLNSGDHGQQLQSPLVHEVMKCGFRVLRKTQWDELKEEYLSYRQRLVDDIAQAESATIGQTRPSVQHAERPHAVRGPSSADQAPGPVRSHREGTETMAKTGEPSRARETNTPLGLDPSSSFPPGCLVYVRNVHPETNKTTLKALISAHAFGSSYPSTASASSALDYVDYSKGMATCHVRVSARHHAQTLVAAFQSRPVVQREGLDGTGSPLRDGCSEEERARAISMEIVQGTREELYWNKVPEKVRREAVRKAIMQPSATEGADAKQEDDPGDAPAAGEREGKRKRKRRRKA
ncbi:hypothetical protein BD414DRAFT_485452 [Trametes punicea]|nr:hypothetical protein BD414DRAFT_485452 [Trametes punicea]